MGVSQTLSLIQSGQSTEENYSKVRVLWKSTQTGQSYNAVERTAKYYVSINGGAETEYSVKYTLPKGATQTIVDATITVPHDDKGNATIKVRTWMDTHISASVVEMSKSLDLTPIPRASTIGASDAFIEANTTIVIARRNADFRHSISYAFGDLAGYIAPDGSIADTEIIFDAPSVSWKIPYSFYNQIPTAPSGVCTLRCTTYSGTKVIGEPQVAQFRITANPASCSPSAAGNAVDVNPKTVALTGNASKMVRFASDVKCTVKGTLAWGGAEVTKVEINGVHVGDNAGVELTIEKIETDSIEIRVTDARGYTGSERLEFEMIPYVRLTNHATATRVDPATGVSILTVEGSCYNGSFGKKSNTLTIQYSVDNGDLETVEAILDGNTYTAAVEIPGLDYRTGCTVEVIVSDELETVTKTVEIGASIPVYYHGKDFFRFNVPVELAGGLAAGFDYSFAGTAAELSDYLYQQVAAGCHVVILSGTYEVSANIPIPGEMTIIGGTFVTTPEFEGTIFTARGDNVRLIGVTMRAPAHDKVPEIFITNNQDTDALCSNVRGIYSNEHDGIALINCVCDKIIPGKLNRGHIRIQGCRITDTPMFIWSTGAKITAIDNDVTICDTGLDYYYHVYYCDGDTELLAINNRIRCDVSTPFFDVYHLMTAGNKGEYFATGIIKGDVVSGNFQRIIDCHYADLILDGCTIRNTNTGEWSEFSNTAHSKFAYRDCDLDYANASEQTYDSSMSEWVRYDNCRIIKNSHLNRRAIYNRCHIEQELDESNPSANTVLVNMLDIIDSELILRGTPQAIGIASSGTLVANFIGNVVRFDGQNTSQYLFNYAGIDGVIANNVVIGAADGTTVWRTDRGNAHNNIINGGAM